MLTKKQIFEIRQHLEKAQNPVFLYDNDADGLCSFLLLRRWLGRGVGVAIRSYPALDGTYVSKLSILNPDYIFVLDKPVLDDSFVNGIREIGTPLVWLDHHDLPTRALFEGMYLYNPAKNKGKNKSDEPVTFLSYMITKRKEDLWIALIGCIADHYLPAFSKEFAKEYPELWGRVTKPFDAYFGTEIGTIAQSFNFGLKDSTQNLEKMQEYLLKCKSPRDVLAEVEENEVFRKNYIALRKKYTSFVSDVNKCVEGNIVYYEYSGETSMSSEIANAVSYTYQKKYVIIVYKKGNVANISMRGNNVKSILENILKKIPQSNGGGHTDAVGARIPWNEINNFKELLYLEIKK